ncbi:hypothetical protein CRI94_16775 [Longibacter salinarum]|uniref:STAS/SEC14 domain-containing protein n=1 Tax=Longibacter salinarum TaxID=1850348 RepID=A0A2A8CTP4_9BACT|nr:STAS/SEC14 domain-containing protein [Longibacter salinarum]PEN11075.1 hypothetical protein CRI94_16775 [Longibacter salinarum]
MIKFLASPDDVVAIKIDQTVDAEQLKSITNRIDDRLAEHETIAMYLDLRGLERFTLAAILDDLRYSLKHIGDLSRIRRVALVTRARWIDVIASWENRVLPSIDIRVFDPEDRRSALDWASESLEMPAPSLRRITTDKDAVRAFALTGPLRSSDIRLLADDLDAAYARHGTIRLLMRVEHYGLRPSVFTQDIVKMKLRALQHVKAYALVGGPSWMAGVASLLDPLMSMEVRHFGLDDENDAWEWLGAAPVGESAGVVA